MNPPQEREVLTRLVPLLEGGMLAIAAFLYCWLRVDPSLRYDQSAPTFQFGCAFLAGFLDRPGGLLEYFSALAAQAEFDPRLGAASFGVLAFLVFLVAGCYLNRLTRYGVWLVPHFPVVVLLVLANRYDAPVLEIGMGILLATGFATLHLVAAAGWSRPWARVGALWVLVIGLFALAGGAPALLLAFLGGCSELSLRRQFIPAVLCWLTMLVPPMWDACFPECRWKSPEGRWGDGWTFYILSAACLVVPAAVLMAVCRIRSFRRAPHPWHTPKSRTAKQHSRVNSGRHRWRPVVYAVFVCVSAGLLVLTFDSRKQAFAQIGHLAGRGNWGQVLAAAGSLTVFPAPERLNLTRALFHTSRLNSELFRFRLDESLDLNPEMKKSWGMYLPLSEVMLELGQLNLAEHFAHEALELEGARPATLRQLVVVQTLKQRPQAARLFQAVLDRIPFHSHFPITGAGIGNQELSSEAAAKPPASWLVKTDYPASRIPTEILLQQALHTNRSNRMAFEYLMAHFLLSRQLGKFSRELNRMVDFDYPAIPRHYEEAILLCRSLSVQPAPDLRGRRISPESNERFGMFCRLLEESRGELKQLEPMIARGYGQTFWYYYYFGENAGQTPKLPANSTGGE